MNSNLYNELIKSLETGYINDSISSEIKYHPEILSNDIVSSKKILTTIEKELKDCDEFWISVAFLTMSGFASIVNVLQELEANQIKGKISLPDISVPSVTDLRAKIPKLTLPKIPTSLPSISNPLA